MRHAGCINAALSLSLVTTPPASAAVRTTCLCEGKERGFLHHQKLCEIRFGYLAETKDGLKKVSRKTCTANEVAQFKTWYCVQNQCIYQYVKPVN